mgnify:CR=1 FL=1
MYIYKLQNIVTIMPIIKSKIKRKRMLGTSVYMDIRATANFHRDL